MSWNSRRSIEFRYRSSGSDKVRPEIRDKPRDEQEDDNEEEEEIRKQKNVDSAIEDLEGSRTTSDWSEAGYQESFVTGQFDEVYSTRFEGERQAADTQEEISQENDLQDLKAEVRQDWSLDEETVIKPKAHWIQTMESGGQLKQSDEEHLRAEHPYLKAKARLPEKTSVDTSRNAGGNSSSEYWRPSSAPEDSFETKLLNEQHISEATIRSTSNDGSFLIKYLQILMDSIQNAAEAKVKDSLTDTTPPGLAHNISSVSMADTEKSGVDFQANLFKKLSIAEIEREMQKAIKNLVLEEETPSCSRELDQDSIRKMRPIQLSYQNYDPKILEDKKQSSFSSQMRTQFTPVILNVRMSGPNMREMRRVVSMQESRDLKGRKKLTEQSLTNAKGFSESAQSGKDKTGKVMESSNMVPTKDTTNEWTQTLKSRLELPKIDVSGRLRQTEEQQQLDFTSETSETGDEQYTSEKRTVREQGTDQEASNTEDAILTPLEPLYISAMSYHSPQDQSEQSHRTESDYSSDSESVVETDKTREGSTHTTDDLITSVAGSSQEGSETQSLSGKVNETVSSLSSRHLTRETSEEETQKSASATSLSNESSEQASYSHGSLLQEGHDEKEAWSVEEEEAIMINPTEEETSVANTIKYDHLHHFIPIDTTDSATQTTEEQTVITNKFIQEAAIAKEVKENWKSPVEESKPTGKPLSHFLNEILSPPGSGDIIQGEGLSQTAQSQPVASAQVQAADILQKAGTSDANPTAPPNRKDSSSQSASDYTTFRDHLNQIKDSSGISAFNYVSRQPNDSKDDSEHLETGNNERHLLETKYIHTTAQGTSPYTLMDASEFPITDTEEISEFTAFAGELNERGTNRNAHKSNAENILSVRAGKTGEESIHIFEQTPVGFESNEEMTGSIEANEGSTDTFSSKANERNTDTAETIVSSENKEKSTATTETTVSSEANERSTATAGTTVSSKAHERSTDTAKTTVSSETNEERTTGNSENRIPGEGKGQLENYFEVTDLKTSKTEHNINISEKATSTQTEEGSESGQSNASGEIKLAPNNTTNQKGNMGAVNAESVKSITPAYFQEEDNVEVKDPSLKKESTWPTSPNEHSITLSDDDAIQHLSGQPQTIFPSQGNVHFNDEELEPEESEFLLYTNPELSDIPEESTQVTTETLSELSYNKRRSSQHLTHLAPSSSERDMIYLDHEKKLYETRTSSEHDLLDGDIFFGEDDKKTAILLNTTRAARFQNDSPADTLSTRNSLLAMSATTQAGVLRNSNQAHQSPHEPLEAHTSSSTKPKKNHSGAFSYQRGDQSEKTANFNKSENQNSFYMISRMVFGKEHGALGTSRSIGEERARVRSLGENEKRRRMAKDSETSSALLSTEGLSNLTAAAERPFIPLDKTQIVFNLARGEIPIYYPDSNERTTKEDRIEKEYDTRQDWVQRECNPRQDRVQKEYIKRQGRKQTPRFQYEPLEGNKSFSSNSGQQIKSDSNPGNEEDGESIDFVHPSSTNSEMLKLESSCSNLHHKESEKLYMSRNNLATPKLVNINSSCVRVHPRIEETKLCTSSKESLLSMSSPVSSTGRQVSPSYKSLSASSVERPMYGKCETAKKPDKRSVSFTDVPLLKGLVDTNLRRSFSDDVILTRAMRDCEDWCSTFIFKQRVGAKSDTHIYSEDIMDPFQKDLEEEENSDKDSIQTEEQHKVPVRKSFETMHFRYNPHDEEDDRSDNYSDTILDLQENRIHSFSLPAQICCDFSYLDRSHRTLVHTNAIMSAPTKSKLRNEYTFPQTVQNIDDCARNSPTLSRLLTSVQQESIGSMQVQQTRKLERAAPSLRSSPDPNDEIDENSSYLKSQIKSEHACSLFLGGSTVKTYYKSHKGLQCVVAEDTQPPFLPTTNNINMPLSFSLASPKKRVTTPEETHLQTLAKEEKDKYSPSRAISFQSEENLSKQLVNAEKWSSAAHLTIIKAVLQSGDCPMEISSLGEWTEDKEVAASSSLAERAAKTTWLLPEVALTFPRDKLPSHPSSQTQKHFHARFLDKIESNLLEIPLKVHIHKQIYQAGASFKSIKEVCKIVYSGKGASQKRQPFQITPALQVCQPYCVLTGKLVLALDICKGDDNSSAIDRNNAQADKRERNATPRQYKRRSSFMSEPVSETQSARTSQFGQNGRRKSTFSPFKSKQGSVLEEGENQIEEAEKRSPVWGTVLNVREKRSNTSPYPLSEEMSINGRIDRRDNFEAPEFALSEGNRRKLSNAAKYKRTSLSEERQKDLASALEETQERQSISPPADIGAVVIKGPTYNSSTSRKIFKVFCFLVRILGILALLVELKREALTYMEIEPRFSAKMANWK